MFPMPEMHDIFARHVVFVDASQAMVFQQIHLLFEFRRANAESPLRMRDRLDAPSISRPAIAIAAVAEKVVLLSNRSCCYPKRSDYIPITNRPGGQQTSVETEMPSYKSAANHSENLRRKSARECWTPAPLAPAIAQEFAATRAFSLK